MLEQAYAQALYGALKGKSESEQETLATRFAARLKERGHGKLFSRIRAEYDKLRAHDAKYRASALVVASEADEADARAQAEKELPEEARSAALSLDSSLVGGFVLRSKGRSLDRSYKRQLLELYRRLTTIE